MQGTDMRLRYISDNLADSRVIDDWRSESAICSSGVADKDDEGNVRVCNSVCPGIAPRACVCFWVERG
jgi:hypothetical protein